MHDHRKLGRELELFDTDPLIGTGLPYWLPAGAAVRHALEQYLRELERQAGYQHVYSPVLGKRELYEISGHWSHYRGDMYPPTAPSGKPPCPPSKSTSTSPGSSICTTQARTGPGIARSCYTAASSAPWSGRSRT